MIVTKEELIAKISKSLENEFKTKDIDLSDLEIPIHDDPVIVIRPTPPPGGGFGGGLEIVIKL